MTMIEAKKAGTAAAGVEFVCDRGQYRNFAPTGSIGRILPELSSHGKVQALLTCTAEGCSELHTREASDWHQCSKCRTHSTAKGGKQVKKVEAVAEVVAAE